MTIRLKFEVQDKVDHSWYGVGMDKVAAPISGLLNSIWNQVNFSANTTELSSVKEAG